MNLSRRQTLKSLAAMATIQIVPSRVLGLGGQTAPSNEITRAIIGCGGISSSHLAMPGKLLALCDVDAGHLANLHQHLGVGLADILQAVRLAHREGDGHAVDASGHRPRRSDGGGVGLFLLGVLQPHRDFGLREPYLLHGHG